MNNKTQKIIVGTSIPIMVLITVILLGNILFQKDSEEVSDPSTITDENQPKQTRKIAITSKDTDMIAQQTKKAKKETSKKSKEDEKSKDVSEKTKPTKKEKSKTKSSTEKTIEPTTKYVAADSLNVRNGPGVNHSVVVSVTKGQSVIVHGIKNSWSKVEIDDQTGWVSGKYLTDAKPEVAKKKKDQSSSKTSKKKKSTNQKEKSTNPKNDADKLNSVSDNNQLILVTSNGYSTTNAKIQTLEKNADGKWNQVLNTTGHIGKNGFATNKKEGDGKTPVGKYTIGTAFGQHGNPGTSLPFKNITSDDVWVDDSDSDLYNSWQSKKETKDQWNSAENMNHRLYTYGFVINYNTQRTPNNGSATFLHVGNSYTLGCVATSEGHVKSILNWIDPSKNPVIIQTPTQDLNKY